MVKARLYVRTSPAECWEGWPRAPAGHPLTRLRHLPLLTPNHAGHHHRSMSSEEEAARCRSIAADERARAEAEVLPNVRERLLRSAEHWDRLAERSARVIRAADAWRS